MKTIEKAKHTISRLKSGVSVESIQDELGVDKNEWFRISAKAYALHLSEARKQQKKDQYKSNVLCTSNKEILEIINLNNQLADFALCLPSISTPVDFKKAKSLLSGMPKTETELVYLVEKLTLAPRIRALQNVGRIQHFPAFSYFSRLVESATLCYYRANFASSYLTLVPVVEGIILRWLGYVGDGKKPEFEEIRKFFDHSHVRQPCPGNTLFHEVFIKVCNKIINEHLYKPSLHGLAYSEFNRHQASHLLRDAEFATRENCIRLFLLVDTMAEIYLYETNCGDPRWKLNDSDIDREATIYKQLILEQTLPSNAEQILLKTKVNES